MNKHDLIKELSSRLNTTQQECTSHLNTLLDILSDELEKKNSLILQGFGTFHLWEQTARAGRNPKTGETVPILSRNSVKFKAGKNLLKKLNKRVDQ